MSKARTSTTATGNSANSTADRAIDILLLFTDDRPTWSASDIAAHFAMPRSTTYRYLNSLRAYALIVEDERGGFRLGPRIFPLARVARKSTSIIRIAAPHLATLGEQFGELAVLHQRVGPDLLTLDRVESRQSISIRATRSHLLPWPATASAKLLLAFAPEAERAELMGRLEPTRFTANTLPDLPALRAALEEIRISGIAYTNEERNEGVWGVAAPVFHRGDVRNCVAIAVPRFRVNDGNIASFATAVQNAATRIGEALGAVDF